MVDENVKALKRQLIFMAPQRPKQVKKEKVRYINGVINSPEELRLMLRIAQKKNLYIYRMIEKDIDQGEFYLLKTNSIQPGYEFMLTDKILVDKGMTNMDTIFAKYDMIYDEKLGV